MGINCRDTPICTETGLPCRSEHLVMGAAWITLLLASLAMARNSGASQLDENRIVPLYSVLRRAIDLYNTEQANEWAFKLLYTIPSSSRVIQFIIKETNCLRSERNRVNECPIKDGGLERHCSMELSEDQDIVTVPTCGPGNEKLSSFEMSGHGSGSGSGSERDGTERKPVIAVRRRPCRRPGACSVIGLGKQIHLV
ncbi:hypothetical protein XENTR_v10015794 [Xenopus tropicalis]|uniref:Uncharacterized protein LOC101731222 n=1 Tax=Xenopus tropicalis TaxID=8364 RepID=A0A8J0R5K6_XENTR|nr:uncharacterized protein LOC101731222 [Xenopus tropicalis]KAE8595544.1 hypothetical protein XENTR_v10015794 [Xenopus tropicalis]|eukprot:XP_004915568.1 PREDICTED: uncharacterized protein LOC101731222 [Xenopus tropicalis]